MPDPPIEPREHYVYALLREDGLTPFYIGLGARHRWLRHEREFDGRNPHKENIIRMMHRDGINPIPKTKLAQGLTRNEAAEMEIWLIREIGRLPHGPLVNMTRGGDGIADIPPAGRERQRQATIDRWSADREGMMNGIRRAAEAAMAPEVRARRRESVLRSWQTPERRGANKAPNVSAEERRARSERMSSPQMRAKLSAAFLPESRARAIKALKQTLATPEAKANRSVGLKKMWAERRQEILQKRAAARANRQN